MQCELTDGKEVFETRDMDAAEMDALNAAERIAETGRWWTAEPYSTISASYGEDGDLAGRRSPSTPLLALPCPFCGRNAIMIPGLTSSVVECRNGGCGVRPFVEAADITKAVEAWNTRANTARYAPSVAR